MAGQYSVPVAQVALQKEDSEPLLHIHLHELVSRPRDVLPYRLLPEAQRPLVASLMFRPFATGVLFWVPQETVLVPVVLVSPPVVVVGLTAAAAGTTI